MECGDMRPCAYLAICALLFTDSIAVVLHQMPSYSFLLHNGYLWSIVITGWFCYCYYPLSLIA
jgi:hypothetical protein